MKNMLLTTTALIAFAGAAAADGHTSITWGGAATVGIARDGGSAAGTQNATSTADSVAAVAGSTLADNAAYQAKVLGEVATAVPGTGITLAAVRLDIATATLDANANLVGAAKTSALKGLADATALLNATFGSAEVATGEFDTYAEVSLTATGSVDLGNGVSVTGAVSVDAGTGYDFADDDGFDAPKASGVSLDYITVDGGAMGALTFDKNDIAHLVDGDDDETGDIKYSNTMGNATVAVVMDLSKDTDPTAARAKIATALPTAATDPAGTTTYTPAVAADVQWSAKLGYVVNDSISVYAAFDEGKGNAFGGSYSMNGMTVSVDSKLEALEAELEEDRSNTIAVSYAVAGFTAGASYNTIEDGNQWGVNAAYAANGMSVAYSTNEGEEWTATAGYELSDAASITAGVNYTEDAFVGVSFTF